MTACGPLCALIAGGAESLPLPEALARFWAAVPPFRRNAYSGHLPPPNRFARDEKKSRKNKIATSPRSADCCPCPSAATDWRDGFTHLRVGQAERLACRWQPNAFCGLAPAPTLDGPRAEEQREERRIRPMPELRCRWQREHRPPEVRENRPVCPCEPLCRANRGGAASVPAKASLLPLSALCGGSR